MARKVFFSFHYDDDNWRASKIRNIGVIEGNQVVSDNDWETIKGRGDQAIKNWIDGQIKGTSCTIVLIGANTAGRKWINYEIEKSWNDGNGVLGIHIHNINDRYERKSAMGVNPFNGFTMSRDQSQLSNIVQTYLPAGYTSAEIYNSIANNMEHWVERAISIRTNY